MLMPKTTVHKNSLAIFSAHDIRRPRLFTRVNAKPQPHRRDHPAHNHFWPSLDRLDPPHILAAPGFVN